MEHAAMHPGRERSLWKYLAATSLVAMAVCLNLLITRKIEPSAAPLLFAAVLIVAWKCGWGPGLLATAIAGAADDYFFIPPLHAFTFNATIAARLMVFLTVSLLTSYLTSQRETLLFKERHARFQAEEANRIKDRFLAVTSHELRTPLSAIVLWTEVLSRETLDTSIREGVTMIQNSSTVLSRMIDDLLDVSRMTTGKLRLNQQPVDLREPIRAAVEALRPAANARNIEIHLSLQDVPAIAKADPVRIQQIANNLVGNAIKFNSERGRIEIQLTTKNSFAHLQVKDSGRGIASEDLPHVFDQFWQANGHNGSIGDGLGLGLAIARDLVRLHDGNIHVESDGRGSGTTFTVDLPLLMENILGVGWNAVGREVVGPASPIAHQIIKAGPPADW